MAFQLKEMFYHVGLRGNLVNDQLSFNKFPLLGFILELGKQTSADKKSTV